MIRGKGSSNHEVINQFLLGFLATNGAEGSTSSSYIGNILSPLPSLPNTL